MLLTIQLHFSVFESVSFHSCLLSTEADKEAVQNPDVYLSHARRFYNVKHFILKEPQLNCSIEKINKRKKIKHVGSSSCRCCQCHLMV